MLVLTRKPGETVMLGEDIQVKIVSVDGDQVKIGIEAPRALKIYRREVYEAIQQENEAALEASDLSVLDGWE
ncbi:carbon storage regulator [Kurthia sp. 3B1D]|uniref:Translational regulator CsrA n=1 Tax=Candidatus Kurthia intestinigallinarum TaxID=1562256 RepID=A0A433RTT5_9BACL|nr:carbon storage regulator CsrA [Kurthia sp. 3B1D]RUS55572.1 carbon storage regulator [Kurthia sp. 3B1D]